jgi:DNA-binding GntR family transcriptional regulator
VLILPEEGRPAETVLEHTAVLDAIRASDEDAAARAMRHHLGQLIVRIEPLEQQFPDFFR